MTQQPRMSATTPPQFIPVPHSIAAPLPEPQPVVRRSALATAMWIFLGLVATAGGAVLAIVVTSAGVAPGSDDSVAGLVVFLTAPFGAIAGMALTALAAFIADRRSPSLSGRSMRTWLVVYGGIAPLALFGGLGLLLVSSLFGLW